MLPQTSEITAEELFQKAMRSLKNRQYPHCVTLIKAAMELERQDGVPNPKMKYPSYLGLALTLALGPSENGIRLCEQAVKRDFFDPDLFCNLGIVYLRNERRKEAFEAFQQGLTLVPKHRRIREEMGRNERRENPVFPGLSRDNILNRVAGKLRRRFRMLFQKASLASD
jgi:hypothetical protein